MDLAAYIRMSTNLQEDSPETQRRIIEEYCQKNGHTVVKWYQDLAKSGGSMEGRAELRELLRDAGERIFEGVIIYKLDRAFRNLGEQVVTLKKLKGLGIKLVAAADPMTEGAAGDLIVNILGAVNQFERELTGERIYHHNRELAKKGKWTGGSRPPLGYGYDKKKKEIYVIPEEAETVRKVYEVYLRVRGISVAAHELNLMGLKTKDGLTWSPHLVVNVLKNPFYTGKVRYGYRKAIVTETGKKYYKQKTNYEIFPGQHESIISDEMFNEVQEIFSKYRHRNKSGRVYIFTGILFCLTCGGTASGCYHNHIKKQGYRCSTHVERKMECPGFYKLEYKIEDAVYRALLRNFKSVQPGNIEKPKAKEVPTVNIEARLARLEQKMQRQSEMYEDGIYDKETFLKRRKATLNEIEELKASITGQEEREDDSEILRGLANSLMDIWQARWEHPEKYRNLIHSLIEKMFTDGKKLDIHFFPFNAPGWRVFSQYKLD